MDQESPHTSYLGLGLGKVMGPLQHLLHPSEFWVDSGQLGLGDCDNIWQVLTHVDPPSVGAIRTKQRRHYVDSRDVTLGEITDS